MQNFLYLCSQIRGKHEPKRNIYTPSTDVRLPVCAGQASKDNEPLLVPPLKGRMDYFSLLLRMGKW